MTASPPLPDAFLDACDRRSINLQPAQQEQLSRFAVLVTRKNSETNLLAAREVDDIFMRHIFDSLTLEPFLRHHASFIDIGSGGGFPGIPLAILLPETSITLLEATGKKADFLSATADRLELRNVTVLKRRAEEAGRDPLHRGKYPCAVARAVAPLRILVELALPLLETGGVLLAQKGRAAQQEIEEARHALDAVGSIVEAVHDVSLAPDHGAVVIELRKASPTPDNYPRRPGIPAKRPL
ncbi:MAG: 16S rRNA (guanine(527)-N(7))-methyltransferase RsmG [Verrucomicrobia bacterium]|nr:16S rRNA (guanine(527)-N(7))-methyltransferase RsmG [Verrucomicrobiota bacterium]